MPDKRNLKTAADVINRLVNFDGSVNPFSIPHGVAFPGSPVLDSFFFRSDLLELFLWNGSAWELISKGGVINAGAAFPGAALQYTLFWRTDLSSLWICTNSVGPVFTAIGGGGGSPLSPLTVTGHAADAEGAIILAPAVVAIAADQTFTPAAGQILIIKTTKSQTHVGGGGGGGWILEWTVGGHTCKLGVDTFTGQMFSIDYAGGFSSIGGVATENGNIPHFDEWAIFFSTDLTTVMMEWRSSINSGNNPRDASQSFGSGNWVSPVGAVCTLLFYVDDLGGSTVHYWHPVAGLVGDMSTMGA